MQLRYILPAVTVAALLATGCSQQRGDARDALEAVETSLADIRSDAARYAPEGLKGVEANLERLNASLKAREYDDVLAGAPQLQKAVGSLERAVASGKAQARAALAAAKTEWEGLNAEVPKMVETIQARVDKLSASKRLPWGINKDEFATAKSQFESMKTTWAAAHDEAANGDPVEASTKGKSARAMGEELIQELKIKRA